MYISIREGPEESNHTLQYTIELAIPYKYKTYMRVDLHLVGDLAKLVALHVAERCHSRLEILRDIKGVRAEHKELLDRLRLQLTSNVAMMTRACANMQGRPSRSSIRLVKNGNFVCRTKL